MAAKYLKLKMPGKAKRDSPVLELLAASREYGGISDNLPSEILYDIHTKFYGSSAI